ncbi:MAG: helix-turn-helix transcriptional regulator [Planctomycetota bacterium]
MDVCFARLMAAVQGHGGRSEAAVLWLRALLDCLASDHVDRSPSSAAIDRIRACCRDIDADPGADWSVAHMAGHCSCSPDHFARLFKRVALISPRAYITRARVQAAGCRLRESDMPIARIAEELGYGSVYHFSSQFRRHTGLSPSAWRAAPDAPGLL